jgi:hypothetical protein
VGDQAGAWPAQAVGHLQRVEDELGAHVRRQLPADDPPRVAVEDEGEVEEAVPGAQVGEVADPLLVLRPRSEVALEEVTGALDRRLVRDRRPLPAATQLALDPVLAHHPGDPVAPDLDTAPA